MAARSPRHAPRRQKTCTVETGEHHDKARRWTTRSGRFSALAPITAAAVGGGDAATEEPRPRRRTIRGRQPTRQRRGREPADDGEAAEPAGDVLSSRSPSASTTRTTRPRWRSCSPIENGYFEEEGITEVEIIETDDYIAGLIGGSLDLTQGDTDVALRLGRGQLVRTSSSPGPTATASTRSSVSAPASRAPRTSSASDLTGGALGSRNQLLLERYRDRARRSTPSDVNFVPQGGNSDATLQAIISGTVDGWRRCSRATSSRSRRPAGSSCTRSSPRTPRRASW